MDLYLLLASMVNNHNSGIQTLGYFKSVSRHFGLLSPSDCRACALSV